MTEGAPLESPRADPDELMRLGVAVAHEAADFISGRLDADHAVDVKASALDLVTEVDRGSEQLITDRILRARPDDGIRGEEGSSVRGTSGVDWVIDPIDGTTSFVYRHPGFAVSIAAQHNGETVAGVVVGPAVGATYAASSTSPTTFNGAPVSCSTCRDVSMALVATGFSPIDERRARQAGHVAALLPHIRDIRRIGSAALDLAAVAAGQVDASYEIGLSDWDWAAGEFLVRRAGGRVITRRDDATGRSYIAACGPGLADSWFAILEELGADQI